MIPKALTRDDGLVHLIAASTKKGLITFCDKEIKMGNKCRAVTCTCEKCKANVINIEQATIDAVKRLYEY